MKSSIRLQNVFRRVSQGAKGNDSVDGGAGAEEKKIGKLFGRRLEEICRVDGEVVVLPPPVTVSRFPLCVHCTLYTVNCT